MTRRPARDFVLAVSSFFLTRFLQNPAAVDQHPAVDALQMFGLHLVQPVSPDARHEVDLYGHLVSGVRVHGLRPDRRRSAGQAAVRSPLDLLHVAAVCRELRGWAARTPETGTPPLEV